jgi:nucleoside-diphosphate-sugar epimerase
MGETVRTVAITGARGYVGSLLRRAFSADGWRSVSLVRRPPPGDTNTGHYDLTQAPSPALLEGVDTLVHGAWDLSVTRRADIWRINVDGTAALLELAKRAGVRRVIFVSSMSAYEGTTQLYGQAKLECERMAAGLGQGVVRLGLVYGPGWGGMTGALRKMTKLPVTPLPAGGSHQYTVHEEDAVTAVMRLASVPEISLVPLGIAHPEPVTFGYLVRAIGRADGRMPHLLPVPWRVTYAALRAGEAVGIGLPFRADSLLGLARPAPTVPNQSELTDLGLSFRPFSL